MKKKSTHGSSPLNEHTHNLLTAAAATDGATAVSEGIPAESAADDERGSGRVRGGLLNEEASGSFPDVEGSTSRVEGNEAGCMALDGSAVPSSLRGRPAVRGGKEGEGKEGGGKRSAVRRRLSWQAESAEGGGEGSEGTSGEERDPMCEDPCGLEGMRETTAAYAAPAGDAGDGGDGALGAIVTGSSTAVASGSAMKGKIGTSSGNEEAEMNANGGIRGAERTDR